MNRVLIPLLLFALVIIGCSSQTTNPITTQPSDQNLTDSGNSVPSESPDNRYLLGYWDIAISGNLTDISVTPLRTADIHLNTVRMLEEGMCTDCLSISNLSSPAPGEIQLDLTIRHPLEDNLNFTAFDLRAIFISEGDFDFPEFERSVALAGTSPTLIEYDGYTNLFNPTEFPYGSSLPPALKYYPGHYATGGDLSATLNPFIAFSIDQPRRMFLPGTEETRTVRIKTPGGGIHFGYAVDASWTEPPVDVTNPLIDFPPEANCIEPYQLNIHLCDELTSEPGDETCLTVFVRSHQISTATGPVSLEAPALFTGTVNILSITNPEPGLFLYSGQMSNELGAGPGTYPVLIRGWCNIPDTNLGPIHAWNIVMVEVFPASGDPVAIAEANPTIQHVGYSVHFYDNGSYDPDGGAIVKYEWDWENDGTFDTEGIDQYHAYTSPGTYQIQFRVTDDQDQTGILAEPIGVEIVDNITDAIDITPEWLSFNVNRIRVAGDCLIVQFADYILVWDITDPLNPVWVCRTSVGDMPYTNHVTSKDSIACVVSGAWGDSRMDIFDVDPPQEFNLVKSILLPDVIAPMSVTIDQNNIAWVGETYGGFTFVDLNPPEDAEVIGAVDIEFVGYPHMIAFEDGYTYLSEDGMGTGLIVCDIQPPDYSEFLGQLMEGGPEALAVDNGFTFITQTSKTQILDITPPDSYDLLKELPGFWFYDLAVGGGYLYGRTDEAWTIYDVDPPEDTFVAGILDSGSLGWNTELAGDYAWIAGEYNTIAAVDITTPDNPEIKSMIFNIGSDTKDFVLRNNRIYTTNSWQGDFYGPDYWFKVVDVSVPSEAYVQNGIILESNPLAIDIIGNYAFCGCEDLLQVVDISSPGSETIIGTAPFDGTPVDIAADGQYAYVVNDVDLHIYDVSVPDSPSLANSFTIGFSADRIEVSDGYAYVFGGWNFGPVSYLFVIDVSPVDETHLVTTIELTGHLAGYYYDYAGMALAGTYVYAGTVDDSGNSQFHVIDISQPDSAHEVNTIDLPNDIYDIYLSGNLAYALTDLELIRIDITDPSAAFVSVVFPNIGGRHLIVDGNYAYTLDEGMYIYELP